MCEMIHVAPSKYRSRKRLLAVSVLFLFGCVYEPDEEYFSEVKQVDAVASIDLRTIATNDTIVLEQPTDFRYRVEISSPAAVEGVEIVVDTVLTSSSYALDGAFHLSPDLITPGWHTLTVRFKAKSNSGSLADNLGGEYFHVWRTWTLQVIREDKSAPPAPVLRFVEADGLLRVEWDPYTTKSFVSYTLIAKSAESREIVYKDSLQTFWVDSSYLFGFAEYTLTVTNAFGYASRVGWVNVDPSWKVEYNPSDTSVLIRWNALKYHKAFRKAVITENNTVREVLTNTRDSTYSLKLKESLWGRSESVMLQIVAKHPQHKTFEKREYLIDPTLKMLRNRPELYYHNGRVIGHTQNYARLYNFDSQMRATDSISLYGGPLCVPYDGNFIYYLSGNAVVRWNFVTGEKFFHRESATFAIEGDFSGASNGLASYVGIERQDQWHPRLIQSVKNTNDNTFILRTEVGYDSWNTNPITSVALSGDGRYGYRQNNRELLKLDGEAGIETVGTTPYVGWFYSFRPDNTDEMFLASSETFTIIGCNDLAVRRTIAVPTGYSISSYDPVTHYITCEKENSVVVHLINIDNGDHKTYPAYSTGYRLLNGFLFNAGGQYKKVI